ncbi:MAG TPA: condensation domain-containing protein [Streptosporangiaceae bacterium]|nr:condensation domain-containing protein [Streptosporangiaceae bacterium]
MADETVPAPPGQAGPESTLAGLSPLRQQLLSIELARRATANRQSIPLLPRQPGVNRLPASPGQERLYFVHELDPRATAYLVPVALWLHGDVDVAALRACLDVLVSRHETLRTGFEVMPGRGVVQVVVPPGAVTADLTAGEADLAELMPLVEQVVRRPFDLGRPPLLRAALWRVRDADPGRPQWLLALCLHHIVVDGWSLGVLVDDLVAAYPAVAAGRQAPLSPLILQYADFAAWQRDQLAGLASAGHLSYWAGELAGTEPLDFAAARPMRPAGSLDGGTVPLRIPAEVAGGLRRLGARERATDFMVLLAALAATVHRWTGQPDFVVGGAVAGRSRPELDRLIGFFVNTLPVRVRLSGPESFEDLVRRVRHTCLAAYSHAEVPFEQIVHAAGSRRRRGRTSLVQVLLAVRDTPAGRLRLPGAEVELIDLPSAGTDLDLVLSLAPAGAGELAGWLAYSCDQFTAETAGQFAAALVAIVKEVAADAGRPVDTLLAGPAGPQAQAEVIVLDDRGRPVPDGAAGEVCVAGLRAGDLGRRRPDGLIEPLGRRDRRISLDGATIDLDYVESVLRDHDSIADAAAIGGAAAGPPGIACYIVPAGGRTAPQDGALARHLGRYLPHQGIAVSFAWLTALPRTAAGHVDYARLPHCDPAPGPDPTPAPGAAPAGERSDPVHDVLSGIWSHALGVDEVGVHDDFFAMGGHSLLATTIVAEVHDLFRCEIGLRFFVETPTIAGLAEALRQEGARAGTDVDKVAGLILQVGQLLDAEVRARLDG